MERVVLPFSGLASWVLILGGILATLQVLGINIQPLLTVGGVSGIVVGLSAQSVMSNMISGINLVSSMPSSAKQFHAISVDAVICMHSLAFANVAVGVSSSSSYCCACDANCCSSVCNVSQSLQQKLLKSAVYPVVHNIHDYRVFRAPWHFRSDT